MTYTKSKFILPLVTIISLKFIFRFIKLVMYIVYIIDRIYQLFNEPKTLLSSYNSDRRECMYQYENKYKKLNT